MDRKTLAVPPALSRKEEAAWWEKRKAAVEADLRRAIRGGTTLSLSEVPAQAKRKKDLQPVTIRLASEDIDTARKIASDKGIGYQTYIKMLLHEALSKEANRRTGGLRKQVAIKRP
jgi:predicted DNA binding CopG/RHH family protein